MILETSKRSGERFNVKSQSWEAIPDMLTGRDGHELATMENFVYAVGGIGVTGVEKFDPKNNTWSEVQSMTEGRSFFAATALVCNEIKHLSN